MPVRVVTDSTCDLPQDVINRYRLTVVPLRLIWGDEVLRDGVDIDAAGFYERLTTSPVHPATSQPLVEDFAAAYEALSREGADIVSIHISSKLSGTVNAATVARQEAGGRDRIEIVDSETVSAMLGGVAMVASEAAEAGATRGEVVAAARRAMASARFLALLDTLEYLRRGGRIGRAQSFVGGVLSIKPLITVRDGEVTPVERVRTRQRAVDRIVEHALADREVRRVFVMSGGNDAEAEAMIARIRPAFDESVEFVRGQFGPIVGVYTGPNALGVGSVG